MTPATEARETALDRLEMSRAEYLAAARATADELGQGGAVVTVDMVRAICPPPAGIDPRVMGAIFRSADWERVGYVNSARRTCHARTIAKFKLVGAK